MDLMNNLKPELKKLVDNELRSRERVSWAGQPIAKQRAISGFALWLFFIPWTGFSIFWVNGAIEQSKGESAFPLFGIPFLLIGIWMLLTPIREWFKANKTVYVVTNQRAFTIEAIKSIKVTNFNSEHITNIEKKINIDGSGDLILLKENYVDSDGDKQTKEKGFFAVTDVKLVENYIQKMCEGNT